MGILSVPVTINGTVCRNCYDVDWARKAESEDVKKRAADTAQKAKDAAAPDSGVGQGSGLDGQSATTIDDTIRKVARAAATPPVAPRPTDTPGQSVNIYV